MSDEPSYRDETWLRHNYVRRGRSMADIGEQFETTAATIKKWCDRYDITTRGRGGALDADPERRFWSQALVGDRDECWEWDGQTDGFGWYFYDGAKRPAHLVAYHIEHGFWPEHGCHHTCDTPLCVNPLHLKADASDDSDCGFDISEIRKLSADEVEEIRNYVEQYGETVTQFLASKHGVSVAVITDVVNHRGAYDDQER